MPPEIADIRDIDQNAARQLVLHAEIVGHDRRRLELPREYRQIRRKVASGSAARVIDVTVENIGDARERRIAAGCDQCVGGGAVIEDSVAAAHRCFAASEWIPR